MITEEQAREYEENLDIISPIQKIEAAFYRYNTADELFKKTWLAWISHYCDDLLLYIEIEEITKVPPAPDE